MNRRAAPHRGIDAHYGDVADDGRPSKTQRKRESHALQDLGESLAALPQDRLDAIAMPEPLREAIEEYRRTRSHEGRRRQMQFVGKLMRSADEDALREALAAATIGSARESLRLHEAERWRAELIADDAAIDRFAAAHPDADLAQLRHHVAAARRDHTAAEQRQSRAARELFRFIRPLMTAAEATSAPPPRETASPDAGGAGVGPRPPEGPADGPARPARRAGGPAKPAARRPPGSD